jgi:methanethiol S-methyltransferase
MPVLIFSIASAIYFILHSLLAAERVKDFLMKNLIPVKYYRLVYNLLAVILLAPIAWLFFTMKKERLLENDWFALPGGLLLLGGTIWIWKAMQGYDLGEFTGVLQLRTGRQPKHISLNVSGLNRLVRHPLYFGTLLVVWGFFLVLPLDAVLVMAVISTVYLFVGSKLEEQKLTQQFGDAYRSYQENVPMLLPFKLK